MAVRQRKDGRWVVYYRAPGGRLVEEYFGRGASAEAAAYARDAELGLLRRRPRREHAGPSFLEVSKEYRDRRGFNENSRKQLRFRLVAHLAPFFGAMPAASIKPRDVDAYVASRRAAGVSDATIRRELTDLKAILSWAAKQDPPLIPYNPIANYPKPRERITPPDPPTEEEVERILAQAPPHLRRAIMLSWYLGLRPGSVELLGLRWRDVRWTSRRILVRSAHKGGPEAREVPIHRDFLPELERWRREDGPDGPEHIVQWRGRRVHSLKRAWRRAVADSKIGRRVRLYDLRHRFITSALEGGADLKALSEVVGSAPKTLLKFYQHVTGRQHEQTVSLIAALRPPRPSRKKVGA